MQKKNTIIFSKQKKYTNKKKIENYYTHKIKDINSPISSF